MRTGKVLLVGALLAIVGAWQGAVAQMAQGGQQSERGAERDVGGRDRGEPPVFADAPPPPAIPGPITEADLVEPEVVIRQEGENTVTEYRVGGKVYLMKVVPARGEPYYLVDKSGDGTFERLPGGAHIAPPMWVIKQWR
ncbi:DUF2782 domain-containing protein [Hydrogenophilus hirschii]